MLMDELSAVINKAAGPILWTKNIVFFVFLVSSSVRAQELDTLPSPLRLEDVLHYGRSHRQEIVAARARARAAAEKPAIVSTLEDPMVMPSIDHLPFMLHGVDVSFMVEQRFPLSGVLGNRRRVAEADAHRIQAEAQRVEQDVLLDAARSFLMVRERRDMERVLGEQLVLARQLVSAAMARYRSGTGNQPEVLRAEIEVARLEGALRAIQSEIAAAEAMLNTSLGRSADAFVPPVENMSLITAKPAPWNDLRDRVARRPELEAGRAEIRRAQEEISVMRSMYWPMGMVRTGPSYTMTDKWGWMVTIGISIPLWRGRLDAGVREAQAMTEMARADLAAMTRMTEGEAAIVRQQVLAARQRVLVLRDHVLPRAKQAIDPSVASYAAGTLPLVGVIDAAQALWSLESELVSAEFELGLAWARLYRAQGQFDVGIHR